MPQSPRRPAPANGLPAPGGRRLQVRRSGVHGKGVYAIQPLAKASVSRAYILYLRGLTDVEIAGGQLVGERDTHQYLTSSTDEWNHGIQISSSKRVTVRDLRVAKCTGDGVTIGAGSSDVVIANIISTQNRRQGLSITYSSNIEVYDSEFSYTQGTKPECGIDIEPDSPYSTSYVWIENCRLNNNAKYGINVWKRSSAITITKCMIERNGSLGISTLGCSGVNVLGNTVRYNSATGIVFNDGTTNTVHNGNLSYGNYTRLGIKVRTPFTQTGWSTKIERDVLIRGTTSNVAIRTNNYQ